MKILVLGLGNDIIADDGLGIFAARQLKESLQHYSGIDVFESSAAGIALLEVFMGYEKAVIIDAVKTGECEPGTIQEWKAEELSEVLAPSPHYAGLPELLALAKQMHLDYPQEFAIYSMEAEDPYTIGKGLTPVIEGKLPELVKQVQERVLQWVKMEAVV